MSIGWVASMKQAHLIATWIWFKPCTVLLESSKCTLYVFFCFPELLFQIVEEQRVSWMRWDVPLVGISLYCYQLATPNNSSQVKIHYDIMI